MVGALILLRAKNLYDQNRFKFFYALTSLTVCCGIFVGYYRLYGWHLYENYDQLNIKIGYFGHLSYSGVASKNRKTSPIIYNDGQKIAVAKKDILTSAAKFVRTNSAKKQRLPNIVFILAESTFDPNKAFNLKSEYRDNSLFFARRNEIENLLDVSVAGGGTLVSEFEIISGLNKLLLGVPDDFVNESLAPSLKQSLVTYLKERGYFTSAFLPTDGLFANAVSTYEAYGFDEFKDRSDLNLESDWSKFSDQEMVSKISPYFALQRQKPFFYHITLLENHSPTRCHKSSLTTEEFRFRDDRDFRKNCELDEYLRHAKSTESAFNLVLSNLQKLERESGRPYIAVIFGDHQGGTFVKKSYNNVRTSASKYTTFYKIVVSHNISLPNIKTVFHINLIPSLVSTALAKSAEDVYIAENFYLFEKCGDMKDWSRCISSLGKHYVSYREYIN